MASTGTIPLAEAVDKTVGDVMMPNPKTLPAGCLVGDVRRAFERPNVRTVLLADGDRFAGAIERGGLPAGTGDEEPAIRYVESDPLTVRPGLPMTEAIKLLEDASEPRLIVLDEDGVTLRGLLCGNPAAGGFCVR